MAIVICGVFLCRYTKTNNYKQNQKKKLSFNSISIADFKLCISVTFYLQNASQKVAQACCVEIIKNLIFGPIIYY